MARRFQDSGTTKRASKKPRNSKLKIVIVSEGERTEPDYFKQFARLHRNGLVIVMTVGLGCDPSRVVQRAIKEHQMLKRTAREQGDSFASEFEVWAVFDRDEHTEFDTPIQHAEANGIKVAYSNPCFELWGLMHYRLMDAPIHRHSAQRELNKVHPHYHHEENPVFDVPNLDGDLYEKALQNAKRALIRRKEEGNHRGNPSTTVDWLTETIRKGEKISKG